jgi:RNA polymerase sigma factor (sigma-70 family)
MGQIHQNDEIELLKQCLTGSPESFAEIVGRYQSLICGLTFALTGNFGKSEELAQETFLLAWKNLKQLRDLTRFKAWLCQIARNVVQNWRRSIHRDVIDEAIPLGHAPEPTALQADPAQQIIRDEEQSVIDRAITSLPEKYRLPLILFYREDKSHREVAELMEISEDATRQRIARARAKLKEQVVQMVATGLEQTKPGKTFTGVVLASIVSISIKGMSVTAATMTTKGTLSAGFSGLAVKITAVAAGLVLLAGATFTIIAQRPLGAIEEPAVPPVAITSLDAGDIPEQPTLLPPLHESPDSQPPNPVIVATPVAANDVLESPEEPIKEFRPSDDDKETYRLACVDTDDKPVSGALVYILQYSYPDPALTKRYVLVPNLQEDGPLTSDANGLVAFQAFRNPDGEDVYREAYAIVPHQRVGVWQQMIPFENKQNEQAFHVRLYKSKTVSGQVLLPEGHDMASVHADIMSIGLPAPGRKYGHSFGSWIFEPWGVFPGVFDVAIDTEGCFEIPDLPADGRFNVRVRGLGLAEAQQHVLDSQHTDFIELKLVPEGVIEGKVQFSDAQIPVVNRRVSCNTYSNRNIARNHVGTTDEHGYYRIEGLNTGTYKVVVRHDTYPPSHIAHAKASVEVTAGRVTDSINFELETGTIVTGRITDKETNAPVEGVLVVVLSPADPGGAPINNDRSDRDGLYAVRVPVGETKFYIGGVPEGVKYPEDQGVRIVSVSHTGEMVGSVDYAFKSDPGVYDPIRTGMVTGRVLNTDGMPISEVLITERHKLEDRLISVSNRKLGSTDEEGRFRVDVQAQAEYQIRVGGYEWSAHLSEWFVLKDNKTEDLGDIYLIPFSLTMSVQIRDEVGTPLHNVDFGISAADYFLPLSWRLRSDDNGMIYLKHLPNSELSIHLARDGYQRQSWHGLTQDYIEIIMKKK